MDQFAQCTLTVDLGAEAAAPGQVLRAVGEPYTADYDTTVLVGGTRAEVVEVAGLGDCGRCERCRSSNGCSACGRCLACDAGRDAQGVLEPGACTGCVQSVDFVVPEVAPGPTTVTMLNRYGTSAGVPLDITEATSATDTGAVPGSDTAPPVDTAPSPVSDTSGPTPTDTGPSPADTSTSTDTSAATDSARSTP